MKKFLTVTAICLSALVTGCATDGSVSRMANHIELKPMKEAAVTGYSENMLGYPGTQLETVVKAEYGEVKLIVSTPKGIELNLLYDGKRYPVTVRLGEYKVAGMFDWNYMNAMKNEGQNFFNVKLIPVAGAGIIPGVSQIALVGAFQDKNQDYRNGLLAKYFYAVQLESDHQWYTVVDHELRKQVKDSADVFFSIPAPYLKTIDLSDPGVPNTHEEVMERINRGYMHWQAFYIGTPNGIMQFHCDKVVTEHYGMRVTPVTGGMIQEVMACKKPIRIKVLLDSGVMNYRIKVKD